MYEKLVNMLKLQMSGLLSRINEEEAEEGDNTAESKLF